MLVISVPTCCRSSCRLTSGQSAPSATSISATPSSTCATRRTACSMSPSSPRGYLPAGDKPGKATLAMARKRAVSAPNLPLMHPRRPQEAAPVGRGHAQLDRAAVAIDRQRHLYPGLAHGPYPPVEVAEAVGLGAVHRQHDVAAPQLRRLG